MSALPVVRFFTHPEFVGFENASLTRHELLDGQIVAMAGATPRQVAISAGVQHALEAAFAETGRHAYGPTCGCSSPPPGSRATRTSP